jgi:hypothetical protein
MMALTVNDRLLLAVICQEADNAAFEAFERQLLEYGKETPE